MESMKLALMQRIKGQMPELARIDEDCGQLETGAAPYPVAFPCVLVGSPRTEWTTENAGKPILQRGTATLAIQLAITCDDHTSEESSPEEKVREREEMNGRLFRAVQGYRLQTQTTPLSRIENTEYALPGGVKVYRTVYQYTERTTVPGQ